MTISSRESLLILLLVSLLALAVASVFGIEIARLLGGIVKALDVVGSR